MVALRERDAFGRTELEIANLPRMHAVCLPFVTVSDARHQPLPVAWNAPGERVRTMWKATLRGFR